MARLNFENTVSWVVVTYIEFIVMYIRKQAVYIYIDNINVRIILHSKLFIRLELDVVFTNHSLTILIFH